MLLAHAHTLSLSPSLSISVSLFSCLFLCVTFILPVETSHLKFLFIKGPTSNTGVILITHLELLYPIYSILCKSETDNVAVITLLNNVTKLRPLNYERFSGVFYLLDNFNFV